MDYNDLTEFGRSLQRSCQDSISVLSELPDRLFRDLAASAKRVAQALNRGGGAFFVGNGGSAAQAEHLVAELVGQVEAERRPIHAVALTHNSATLTALVNDFPPTEVFVRPVLAAMEAKDVLVALSTSGRSPNILRALEAAGEIGCTRVVFAGQDTSCLEGRCEWLLSVPSSSVVRIQEAHLVLGHLLCQAIEEVLCPTVP